MSNQRMNHALTSSAGPPCPPLAVAPTTTPSSTDDLLSPRARAKRSGSWVKLQSQAFDSYVTLRSSPTSTRRNPDDTTSTTASATTSDTPPGSPYASYVVGASPPTPLRLSSEEKPESGFVAKRRASFTKPPPLVSSPATTTTPPRAQSNGALQTGTPGATSASTLRRGNSFIVAKMQPIKTMKGNVNPMQQQPQQPQQEEVVSPRQFRQQRHTTYDKPISREEATTLKVLIEASNERITTTPQQPQLDNRSILRRQSTYDKTISRRSAETVKAVITSTQDNKPPQQHTLAPSATTATEFQQPATSTGFQQRQQPLDLDQSSSRPITPRQRHRTTYDKPLSKEEAITVISLLSDSDTLINLPPPPADHSPEPPRPLPFVQPPPQQQPPQQQPPQHTPTMPPKSPRHSRNFTYDKPITKGEAATVRIALGQQPQQPQQQQPQQQARPLVRKISFQEPTYRPPVQQQPQQPQPQPQPAIPHAYTDPTAGSQLTLRARELAEKRAKHLTYDTSITRSQSENFMHAMSRNTKPPPPAATTTPTATAALKPTHQEPHTEHAGSPARPRRNSINRKSIASVTELQHNIPATYNNNHNHNNNTTLRGIPPPLFKVPSVPAVSTLSRQSFSEPQRPSSEPHRFTSRVEAHTNNMNGIHQPYHTEDLTNQIVIVATSRYNIKPQQSEDLELKKGDRVVVLKKWPNWWKGVSLTTGAVGVFSSNYVTESAVPYSSLRQYHGLLAQHITHPHHLQTTPYQQPTTTTPITTTGTTAHSSSLPVAQPALASPPRESPVISPPPPTPPEELILPPFPLDLPPPLPPRDD